jgi:hypothetical protein
MMKYCRWFILIVLLTVSGCHGSGNGSAVHVSTDFESGSIGEVLIQRDWGSSLLLTLVENCQRSNVDLTPNHTYLSRGMEVHNE